MRSGREFSEHSAQATASTSQQYGSNLYQGPETRARSKRHSEAEAVRTQKRSALNTLERSTGVTRQIVGVLECEESFQGAVAVQSFGQGFRPLPPPAPTPLPELENRWVRDIYATDPEHFTEGTHLGCPEYHSEIFTYLRQAEIDRSPAADYMERLQRDVNAAMRGILVDWMVEVGEEYKLQPETLFLAVGYVDRFLSRTQAVPRSKLQLVGVTAMMLAAKYEEIYAPHVDEFVYITDNTYRKEELLEMEWKILDTLEYQLCMPTARLFLARLLKAAQVDADAIHLCHFLAEMGLLDYKTSVSFRPSEIAASCLLLTSMLLPRADWGWSRTVEALSGGYRPGNLRECANSLFRAVQSSFQRPGQLPAIREKYAVQAYNGISKAVEPQLQRMQALPEDLFVDRYEQPLHVYESP